ncbi:hypothetical protein HPB52_006515 [Rhipicephalus sanguineus]|uniref:Uncharacterized protein n=1 Tax=Rhipicephalus sanguineus TaxID=34632 RepID=A0A9D4PV26_RHISA|nr:hypothetical protein HPB52_006515 [Rhipicephalus sanguineus]
MVGRVVGRPLVAGGESGDENIPLGDGSFQKRVLIITVFTGAVYYAQILLFWMTWREMDHWCRRPSGFANMSVAAWKELAIPRFANGSYSHCTVRVPPHGGNWARVEPCVEWEFDMDEHGNTAVSQWSVVCERRRLADVAQGAHMAAMIVAFFVLGPIADHIGRKTVGVLALAASLITLAATSVATDLQTFIVVRSVAAAATAGLFVFKVLLYEITTMTRRLLYTAFGTTLSFVFPHLLLTIAITLKVSWTVCHSLLALFALVLLAAFHVLDESPSWLIAAHREDEAKRVALRVANINQAPISDCQEFFKKRMYRAQHLPDGTTGTIQASHVKRQDLRLTYALTVFIWTVLGFTHVHFKSRCTGSSVGLAFYVIGTATGLVTFLRVLKSREDSALAAETMLMAATAVAIVYVPSADVFLLTSIDSVTPVSLPSKQSPVDSAQPPCSSAVPVVAEAETKASPADVRLAARKKAKAKQMPEQYAVRASGLPMNW